MSIGFRVAKNLIFERIRSNANALIPTRNIRPHSPGIARWSSLDAAWCHELCFCLTQLCSCAKYTSNWLCVVCESHGEDHETVWETEDERKSAGRPTGAAFLPFSETPEIAKIVFAPGAGEGKRRNEAGPQRPRIGHDSSAAPSLGPRMSSASTSSGTRRAPSGPARPDDDELSKLTASMSVSSPSSTMSSPGRPPTSSTRPVSRSGIGSGVSRVGSASSTSSRVSS